MNALATLPLDLQLADEFSKFMHDPLGFVLFAYPWGEPGPLALHDGPDVWQAKLLKEIGARSAVNEFDGTTPVQALREAVSSGHGVGKSTLAAWLVDWIMCTRPFAQGTVTANTYTQLRNKTWAQIKYWTNLCIASHWFKVTDDKMYHVDFKDTWFCAPQSCKEENSEAFAGQHAAGSTSFYLFDESSGITDKIFEVSEGGLTDGEPMIFLLGNVTRSQGKFYRATNGVERDRWHRTQVDSRESKFTNKKQIEEWIQDYGEDSDFVRVRVRGLPPRASDAQFIDHERVLSAQRRTVVTLPTDPLVAGCDLAWGGSDDNVIRFRLGNDARSLKPIKIKGEFTREPMVLTNRLSDVLSKEHVCGDGIKRKVHMLFLDSAGIAGPIGANLRALGHRNVMEVNFGADSPDPKCAYMRDYMWQGLKEFLLNGAIDADAGLETDLVAPGVLPDTRQRIKLESKKDMKARGCDSPDDADALALTFAVKVATVKKPVAAPMRPASQWS